MKIRFGLLFVGLFFLILGGIGTYYSWVPPLRDYDGWPRLLTMLFAPTMAFGSLFAFIGLFDNEKRENNE